MASSTVQIWVLPSSGLTADFSVDLWTAASIKDDVHSTRYENFFNPDHLWSSYDASGIAHADYTSYETSPDIGQEYAVSGSRYNRATDMQDAGTLSAAFDEVVVGVDAVYRGTNLGLVLAAGSVQSDGIYAPVSSYARYTLSDGSFFYVPLAGTSSSIGHYFPGGVSVGGADIYAPSGTYLRATVNFLAGAFVAIGGSGWPDGPYSAATSDTVLQLTGYGLIPGRSNNKDIRNYNEVDFDFPPPGDLVAPSTGGGSPIPVACLAQDAHRRPLACATNSGSLTGYYSNDAGHTFSSSVIAASGTDPSLLVDTRSNRFRVLYSASGLQMAFGTITDGFPQDAGSPAAIAGLSGAFPVAALHPTDRDYALLAYLDSGTLKTATSYDGGATWASLGTVASGLDFTSTGRAGLCWLGEMPILVYGSGSSLLCVSSPDRGATWGSSVSVGSSGPYSGLSLLGWQGRLYLLAWTTSGSTSTPALYVSSDLGATWAASAGTLPTLTPPTGLGIIPQSGQLRLGTTNKSDDDSATWVAD